MGLFSREKKPEPSKEEQLREHFVEQCNLNVQGILKKLALKREEMLNLIVAQGREEDIEEGFEILADFISGVDWNVIVTRTLKAARWTDVNNNWTNRIDVENTKFLLNMQWKIIRVDLNEMIAKVMALVEDIDNIDGAEGESA